MVLGVEKAARMSDMDDTLKNEVAPSDGLQFMRKAYDEALDGIVLPLVNSGICDNPKK